MNIMLPSHWLLVLGDAFFHSFNRLAEHWLNCHSNYILYQFSFIFFLGRAYCCGRCTIILFWDSSWCIQCCKKKMMRLNTSDATKSKSWECGSDRKDRMTNASKHPSALNDDVKFSKCLSLLVPLVLPFQKMCCVNYFLLFEWNAFAMHVTELFYALKVING